MAAVGRGRRRGADPQTLVLWIVRFVGFGRLVGLGIITSFFLYFFINTGMVMGLLPVVGVPLPLISYGGTAMLAVMLGFGLLINVGVHGDTRLSRSGESRPS